MLTNLNWLQQGASYPPTAEKERIDRYKINEELFLTQHAEAWKNNFQEIAKRMRKKNYNVDTVFNYQQLLNKKTADFVCGEPPTIETEQDTDRLSRVLKKHHFDTRLYEAIIDVSRYGNAMLKIVGNRLTAVSPQYWFPIVAPTDLKEITQHVIAYLITPDNEGDMMELYVEIHDIGRIEQRIYAFDGKKSEIGELKSEPSVAPTNLQGFAVQDMQKSMIEKLQNEGFMTVQYGSGKRAYQVGFDS